MLLQGFIQDFFPGGGGGGGEGRGNTIDGNTFMVCRLGGSGGMPPLRLLLVASESTSQFGLLLHIFTFFMTYYLVGIATH